MILKGWGIKMINFLIRRKIFKLVKNLYNYNLYAYEEELEKIPQITTEKTSYTEFCNFTESAAKKYYEKVFNVAFQLQSENNNLIAQMLPLKLMAYHFDPKNIRSYDIYAFLVWAITDKKAKAKELKKIDEYVRKLQKPYFDEAEKKRRIVRKVTVTDSEGTFEYLVSHHHHF